MSPREWHEAWGAVAQDALADAARSLPPSPAAGTLDVGAGLGVAWPALAALGARVTAIEADADLVNASRRRAASLGVALHHADARTWLDSGEAPYGLIWAGDVLWCNYFPDPQAIVHRLMQALVPGGRLAVFTGNWYGSRFLWGYPDLERAVLRVNARRWRVPADGDACHHERAAQWLAAAGGVDLRASLHPLLGHRHASGWDAWRRYLEVGVWPDYLAAARDAAAEPDLDVALLEALVTPGQPDYVLEQPGYVAYQPALLVSARREVVAARSVCGADDGASSGA